MCSEIVRWIVQRGGPSLHSFHSYEVSSNLRGEKTSSSSSSLSRGGSTKVEQTLKFMAYLLQQMAAQVEVSTVPPFAQRPSRLGLDLSKVEIGEPWEVPRVWLEWGYVVVLGDKKAALVVVSEPRTQSDPRHECFYSIFLSAFTGTTFLRTVGRCAGS